MTSHPGVWTSHTGQAGCVQLVLAPHIILTHELCAHLLAKIVPTLSKWTEKRLGFSLILKLYCVMVNRILIQFLQRFVFSLHFSCARKNLCYQGNIKEHFLRKFKKILSRGFGATLILQNIKVAPKPLDRIF